MAATTAFKQKRQQRGPGKPFAKGVSGNPAGRPKGSRNKLQEDAITALCEDFEKYGVKSIEKMRKTDPSGYTRLVFGLIPKDMNVNLTGAEQFVAAWKALSSGAA